MKIAHWLWTTAFVSLLGGCVTLSPDGGMSSVVERIAADEGRETAKVETPEKDILTQSRARALLKRGLGVNDAVQIALLRNKGLQAAYNELGISEARYVHDSLPPNPALSISKMSAHLELDIERKLIADLLSLATLPARQDIAQTVWRKAQLDAVAATVRLTADVRRQYWKAVAARAQTQYLVEARAASENLAELAQKLGETGALNRLDQGREFAFYAELSAEIARARTQEQVEKERLTRLMGLWQADERYELPRTLPPLPGKLLGPQALEALALSKRVDVQIARLEMEKTAKELGLTQATRFVDAIELSAAESISKVRTIDPVTGDISAEKNLARGAELTIAIPLFDFGEARSREAQETYLRAANLLAEKGVNARSEVRETYMAYKGAHDVARLYQSKVLPLRKLIQDESMLHYNGMLADLFVLLQDARSRILSNVAAIDARRDFFLAEADLRAALTGVGISGSDVKPAAAAGGGDAAH